MPNYYEDSTQPVDAVSDNQYMTDMKKPKGALDSSLVGRKCTAKYSHLWFGAKEHTTWHDPLPTTQGTIVAAFTSREDGETNVKVIVESENGETRTFYADNIMLVPVPK